MLKEDMSLIVKLTKNRAIQAGETKNKNNVKITRADRVIPSFTVKPRFWDSISQVSPSIAASIHAKGAY